ncbi:hypothetical protein [Flavihumibacter fluvii]|uniref:hypothetical protein n=1 Tax=Flavihumibacter fluvii TaxID=2838157 RepID=UPI001BDE3803|nr:hypothetical protein [Flavihumibacter fluvii]ULQ53376.1 hypothetical protein KJS93_03470 [Flavihumibacter fluvii]
MTKASDIPVEYPSTISSNLNKLKPNRGRARYFFVAMAILFPAVAFLGFFPSFEMMNEGALKVHWLTHAHSAVMTSWLLLFFTQTLLSVTGNLKFHRRLGLLSVVLAVLVLLMMGVVSFNLIITHSAPEGSFTFDLLIGGFYEMFGFALFFTWGMLSRKKNLSAHKRLMAMATIVLLEAAVDRIQLRNAFPSFGLAYPATNFIYADILYIPLFLYDWITLKRIHRATLLGTAIVFTCQIMVCTFYGSPSWHKFWYAQTAPLMKKVVEVELTDTQSAPLLGHYESNIGKIYISQDNGKLYVQFDGRQKQELCASSETTLYSKQEAILFSFVKGPEGKVESAQAEQIGRTYKMTRIDQP